MPLLVEAFVKEFSAKYGRRWGPSTTPAWRMMAEHEWPGNVRELRNCVERAVVAASGA